MPVDAPLPEGSQAAADALVVGLSVELLEAPQYQGQRRVQLFTAYLDCLRAVGLVPLLFPPDADARERAVLLDRVDGLLLTGGDDVDMSRDGGLPPPPEHGVIMPAGQQQCGLGLAREAAARRMPTLGICLGMQFLGLAAGAPLIQHLDTADRHTKGARHAVKLRPDSCLSRVLGERDIEVPSYHHQAVEDVPRGWTLCGRSPDGVIEAMEDPRQDFYLGVQWHPERDAASDATRALFSGFAAAVARYREHKALKTTHSSPS